MAAVWMRFRAELRARWVALLALTVLVGVAGGVTLAALAGARRTDTAYARLVRTTEAWDVLVNPDRGSDSALDDEAVARLGMVRDAGRVDGLFVGPGDPGSFVDFFEFGLVLASDGIVGYDFARPRMVAGRMPRADRPHEVLVNPLMAERRGYRVGDRIPLLALTGDDVAVAESGLSFDEIIRAIESGELGTRAQVTVTGIGDFPENIVVDEGFENPSMVLTPAFLERHPEAGIPFWGSVLRLRDGARDLPALRRAVAELIPDEPVAFQTQPRTTTKVERAVRPSVGALTIFAAVVALTGLLVVGQTVSRDVFLGSTDHEALRAIGSTRGQLFATSMLRVGACALAGAAVAVGVAVLLSPLTPIGVARRIEPDPGVDVAAGLLGLGFLVIAILVVALAAWPAWRAARAHRTDPASIRPSRVAAAATDLGLPVPVVAGVRMALEPGRGRTSVPVRTTILGAGLAIATVVGAAIFALSLDHLVSTPRLFGWNWDTQVSVNAQEEQAAGTIARDEVVEILDGAGAVSRWGTVSLSEITVDGEPVPAVGIDRARGAALPTLVDGSLPRGDDEIALGRLTQRALDVSNGEEVTARDLDGQRVRMKVVGTVVLPGLGTYPGADKTSLGEGAVVTRDRLYSLGPDFGRDDFVVAFADTASAQERAGVLGRLEDVVTRVDPEGFGSEGVQRPSDIVAYDRVRSTPMVLAFVLAVLASATVAHALVTAVTRRRRELALLATLGLTRRQLSSTVAWQATTVGVCALLIGVPLGVVGGRWAWGLLADDLGTPSEPRVPVLAMFLGALVVVALCNAVAYVPGRIAARVRPAVVLRSE